MYGLIVEGPYDEAVYRQFIFRCAGQVPIVSRSCSTRGKFNQLFPIFLKEFRTQAIRCAIVIRDADNKDPVKLLESMQARIMGRSYVFQYHLLLAVQSMEAWLLADEKALISITKNLVKPFLTPEKIFYPKQELRNLLSAGKLNYTEQTACEIAEAADLDTIAFRCPGFRLFREAIIQTQNS